MKWIAKFGEEEFLGNNPEDAVGKLTLARPELVGSDIKYNLFKPKANCCIGKKTMLDLGKCPSCGKNVVFARAKKENGRMGVMVFHEDELPEGAEVNPTATDEYKRWLLKDFHKAGMGVVSTTETKITEPLGPIIENDSKIVAKPKVVIAKPIATPRYEAEVLADRPTIEIDGLKHNRFAMIGQIVNKLRDNIPEPQLKSIRSDLMTHGKDLNTLMNVASRYAVIYEKGLPIHMESSL